MFCLDTKYLVIPLGQPIRAELLFGAKRSGRATELTSRIEQLLAPFTRLLFDPEAAMHYAEIHFYLEKQGTPISRTTWCLPQPPALQEPLLSPQTSVNSAGCPASPAKIGQPRLVRLMIGLAAWIAPIFHGLLSTYRQTQGPLH